MSCPSAYSGFRPVQLTERQREKHDDLLMPAVERLRCRQPPACRPCGAATGSISGKRVRLRHY